MIAFKGSRGPTGEVISTGALLSDATPNAGPVPLAIFLDPGFNAGVVELWQVAGDTGVVAVIWQIHTTDRACQWQRRSALAAAIRATSFGVTFPPRPT